MTAGKQLDVFEVAAEIERERQAKIIATKSEDKSKEEVRSNIKYYEERRNQIQKQIDAIDEYVKNEYDNGIGDVEDRNERNSLENELRSINKELEELYNER